MGETNPVLRRRKRPDGGEDSFFVSKIGSSTNTEDVNEVVDDGVAFAVADGVGGWTESRVDPGDFSHGLCGYMAHTAMGWRRSNGELRAKDLLEIGYDKVIEDEGIVAGGSTATVGISSSDGQVNLAKYIIPLIKEEEEEEEEFKR